MRPVALELGPGRSAAAVAIELPDEIPAAVDALDLDAPRPTLVVVGGADGLSERLLIECAGCVDDLVSAASETGAAIVDGGTDAGVMRLLGHAHARAGTGIPLVGVIVRALAAQSDGPAADDAAAPEPNHTHFVLVPGSRWGDESPWIAGVAGAIAGDRPSVTVLINGGEISWTDVAASVEAGRPVLTVAGSGRTADALAAAVSGAPADERTSTLVRVGLVQAVALGEDASPSVQEKVREMLGNASTAHGS